MLKASTKDVFEMEWLYFKTPKIKENIDKQEINFGRSGEFSPEADISFEKHLQRLDKLNKSPMFGKMNGRRLENLYQAESFRYWRP